MPEPFTNTQMTLKISRPNPKLNTAESYNNNTLTMRNSYSLHLFQCFDIVQRKRPNGTTNWYKWKCNANHLFVVSTWAQR